MSKLSIRRRGKKGQGTTGYEVGEAGVGPAVTVTAANKREALKKARPLVREIRAREAASAEEHRRMEKDLRKREKVVRWEESHQKKEG